MGRWKANKKQNKKREIRGSIKTILETPFPPDFNKLYQLFLGTDKIRYIILKKMELESVLQIFLQ